MWRPFSLGGPIRLVSNVLKTIFIVAWLAASFALLIYAGNADSASGPTNPVDNAPDLNAAPLGCSTITAQRYNSLLKIRRQLTGHNQRFKHSPVCVKTYRELKRSVAKSRKSCKAKAITTGASWYGGSGDSMTTGTSGAYGDLSGHPWSFAELDMGHAMGTLPPLSWWYVRHGSQVKRSQKRDVGGGGGPIGGVHRGIDLWYPLASFLNATGNAVVQVSKRNCWA